MPEFKHNFAGGKMNKDVDERLLPNGEYRHAMNIQVSTSDDSDVGTIQNILGNKILDGQAGIPSGSTCIGSVSDEKNDTLYWFTTENSFKSAFEDDNPSIIVEAGSNQQQQGDPWLSNYWNPPLDGLNGFSTSFFKADFYTKKRKNTIYQIKEIETDYNSYDYDIKPVFIDDAGLLVTCWQPQGVGQMGLSQTDLAQNMFASGVDNLGNTYTCTQGSSCFAFNSAMYGGHSSYGFINNGMGFGSNNGPVPGVQTSFQLNIYDGAHIKIGDTVQGIGFNPWSISLGYEPYQNFFPEDTVVTNKITLSKWFDHAGKEHEHVVVTLNKPVYSIWYDAVNNKIEEDLSFVLGQGLTLSVLVSHFVFDHSVLKFSTDNLITGVNIIDDMLFWTDNNSEPKKINIPRSIEGTDPSGEIHTKLINKELGIDINSGVNNNGIDIQEKHITVIKKSPTKPPVIKVDTGRDDNKNYSGIIYTTEPGSTVDSSFLNSGGSQSGTKNFQSYGVGDIIYLRIEERTDYTFPFNDPTNFAQNSGFQFEWNTGENREVVLKECDVNDGTSVPTLPVRDWRIKGIVKSWSNNNFTISSASGFGSVHQVKIEITAINDQPPTADSIINGGVLNYVVDLFDKSEKIFEYKFPRFAYRYQYEDGEYSTFSPFTEPAFLPGGFDYHPKKGYNLAMTNTASAIKVNNFIPDDMPLDVVKVDILYKDDASPSIYLVESIKPQDSKTVEVDDGNGNIIKQNFWDLNEFIITDEVVNAVLPENQLLRPWDNVPRKALAQDVSGSRIIYGNYLQNYSLQTKLNTPGSYMPDFKHSLVEYPAGTTVKSIKSLREYQLGVTFLDKYGRETPILTNPNGSFKVSKQQSVQNNRIKVGLRGQEYPNNMKFMKFYIKETSGEYYNMAMDRYYDAEDGNMWLAFPSSDRNKIDIDTFLILKKGVSSDTLVTEKARYKILAIENEAPDYVKTERVIVAKAAQHYQVLDTDSTSPTFGAYITNTEPLFTLGSLDGAPKEGGITFRLNWNPFKATTGRNLEKILEKEMGDAQASLHVDFVNTTTGAVTDRYKIAELTADREDDGTADNFFIRVTDDFGSDVNILLDNPSTPANAIEIEDKVTVRIWKYSVTNRPQFDGRFFVKIYIDEIFQKHIKAIFEGEIEYAQLASKEVYHMPSHDIYMSRMHGIVGWAGGNSSSSITGNPTHPYGGDTSSLGRYMAYFQPIRMYSQTFHDTWGNSEVVWNGNGGSWC